MPWRYLRYNYLGSASTYYHPSSWQQMSRGAAAGFTDGAGKLKQFAFLSLSRSSLFLVCWEANMIIVISQPAQIYLLYAIKPPYEVVVGYVGRPIEISVAVQDESHRFVTLRINPLHHSTPTDSTFTNYLPLTRRSHTYVKLYIGIHFFLSPSGNALRTSPRASEISTELPSRCMHTSVLLIWQIHDRHDIRYRACADRIRTKQMKPVSIFQLEVDIL